MNIKNYLTPKKQNIKMAHTDPLLVKTMGRKMISWFPKNPTEYIAAFIGTDRATGDSLGPLAGTLFQDKKPKNITMYGTLKEPIHAKNLEEYILRIKEMHNNPFIIAIDACLGRSNSVGQIIIGKGPLVPGAALKKDLPPIGHINMTGVVNISGFMDFAVLQNTRLSIVYDMSHQIANILSYIDHQLAYKCQTTRLAYPTIYKQK